MVGLVKFVGATSRTEMFRLWGIGKPKTPTQNEKVEKIMKLQYRYAAKDPPGFYYTVGEESAMEKVIKLVIHTYRSW